MEEIEVKKPTDKELSEMGVSKWPIWQKEVSTFDWSYDSTEMCYLLAGKVVVKVSDGKEVEFGKGDFVTFPEGLSCTWEVKEPVRKHYKFK
ncbi:MAG: cupin domain-containing protein [Nitrospirae bacterium]|nr:cupin domain-containing protein [Nitrospirota bacterium]MBF0590576.1 cupin domain-containing protein [Nitrospirota bacterium]